MFSRSEFLDHLLVESRDVIRLAARDEAVVDHDFFVHPSRAGIFQVYFSAGQEVIVRPRTKSPLINTCGP